MNAHSSNRIDLGTVKIHKDVIASIASIAALEVDGVKEMGRTNSFDLAGFLGLKKSRGIRVEIGKNDELKSIEIPLIVKYGYNIPEIAERVQENVRAAIEKMTDKSPRDINLKIQGIDKT